MANDILKINSDFQNGKTKLIISKSHEKYKFLLIRDSTVSKKSKSALVSVIAKYKNKIIITDTYDSIPGSLSYCRSGEEKFLRVLLIEKSIKELMKIKIASCHDNIELDSPGIEWIQESAQLKINWISSPLNKQQETKFIHLP